MFRLNKPIIMEGRILILENTTIKQLRQRVEFNYSEYRRQMLALCGECIFEFAAEIAAVREVYSYVMAYEWTSDEIAHLLLKFDNPLRIIVDEWRGYQQDNNAGFESFAFEFTMDFLSDDIIVLSTAMLDYIDGGPDSE